jgi:hypothetical protein
MLRYHTAGRAWAEKDVSLGMFLMPSCAAKITAGANPLGGYLLVTMDV